MLVLARIPLLDVAILSYLSDSWTVNVGNFS